MFSSFLSNFEEFINKSKLEELEDITGNTLIKEIGAGQDPKLQFLNQGVNSKELILHFLLGSMGDFQKHVSDPTEDVSLKLIKTFKQYSHLRIKWASNPKNNTIYAKPEQGNKRQLSVKSRGAYYTPRWMSDFMCKESIQKISEQKIDTLEEYIQNIIKTQSKFELRTLLDTLPIKIVDLSMGIGNFLCDSIPYLVEYLKNVKEIINKSLIPVLSEENVSLVEFSFPFLPERNSLAAFGQYIAQNCIYGNEVDPRIYKMAKIVVCLKIRYLLGTQHLQLPNLLCRNSIISMKNPPKIDNVEDMIDKVNGVIYKREFPEVFKGEDSGFDIIIGNPPWEILKPNNREFFNNYYEGFISLSRGKQDEIQDKLLDINKISSTFDDYIRKINQLTSIISFLDYSHQSSYIQDRTYSGDPQLFKYFLEMAFLVIRNNGIISLLVQHNFMGSKGCADLRKLYVNNGRFKGIWEFHNKLNEGLIFQNVDPNLRFIVFQFQKCPENISYIPYKRCKSRDDLTSDFPPYTITSPDFYFIVSKGELQLFGFESESHRNVFTKILSTKNDLSHFLWMKGEPSVLLSQDIHLTRERHKFSKNPTSISIYGGRNFGPYYFRPIKQRYLYESWNSKFKIPKKSIICRNILPNSAKRIIFSVPPENILVDNSCTRLSIVNMNEDVLWFLLAIGNSLLVEFYLRSILTGMNLNYYLIRRIPIPSQKTLTNSKNTNLVQKIAEWSKNLTIIPLETSEWAETYAKMEILIGKLFKLNRNEIEVVLDRFNLKKLNKTKFGEKKPFLHLTKQMFLDYYDSTSSRFT